MASTLLVFGKGATSLETVLVSIANRSAVPRVPFQNKLCLSPINSDAQLASCLSVSKDLAGTVLDTAHR